jgi:hypothetical protein
MNHSGLNIYLALLVRQIHRYLKITDNTIIVPIAQSIPLLRTARISGLWIVVPLAASRVGSSVAAAFFSREWGWDRELC